MLAGHFRKAAGSVSASTKTDDMKKVTSFVAILIIIAGCKKNTTTTNITDIDGNVYNPVKIGNQVWMKENFNTTRYRNGDLIQKVTDPTAWAALTTGAWCWYNNDSANYASTIGKLYNWFAVNDSRGFTPPGWHVPSDAEWTKLSTFLGGDAVAGGALKDTGTKHWFTPNGGATNSTEFTGLPGGRRHQIGIFKDLGIYGIWWSSTEIDTTKAWSRSIFHAISFIHLGGAWKGDGVSVRCLRD